MKQLHTATSSCTSCVYRNWSKQPSVQQLIEDGSSIDKLYYGKYLPLRERKLLEKLIRTRAVYDDVRNRLLSTSGSSDQRSEHKMKRRDDDSTKKSSAVLEMVDVVDRGQLGSSKSSKLSNCCSCCSCTAMKKNKKCMEKHPCVRHPVLYEDIARYTVEDEKRGRRRRRKLSTKISSKIRSVRFEMKQIRSDPCTCTFSLSSMIKRTSKALLKKVRSKDKPIANAQAQKDVTETKALKKKLYSCPCKIAKLPMQSFHKTKNIRKIRTKISGTEMRNQRAFRIKKKSLTLFREKLLTKQILIDWECEHGTCAVQKPKSPKQKPKLMLKETGTQKKVYKADRHAPNRIESFKFNETKRVLALPRIALMNSIPQSKATKYRSKTIKLKPRPQLVIKDPVMQEKAYKTSHHKSNKIKTSKTHEIELAQATPKSNLGHLICDCKPSTISFSSMTFIPKSKTKIKAKPPKSTNQEKEVFKPDRYIPIKEPYKYHETSNPLREVILPFPRDNPENCARILLSRSKSRGRFVMLTTNRLRRKSTGSKTSSLKTGFNTRYIQSKSTGTFLTISKELLREPPSVKVEKDTSLESSHPRRQAVRIASNFSFNFEHYKDKSPGAEIVQTQDLSYEPKKKIKQKVHRKKYKERGHESNNINSRHISSQSRSSESFKNIQVGQRLKRSFCSLKPREKQRHTVSKKTIASLHNKDLQRRARIRKTQTKPSEIAYVTAPINAGIEASLLPYECEPKTFCTPGECNPYECAEGLIELNRKRAKRFSEETNTASTSRKSTLTSISQTLSKTSSRKIQSSEDQKEKQREKSCHLSRREYRSASDTTKRPTVRFGSNFDFNKEIFKPKKYQQSAHGKKGAKDSVPDKLVKQERKRMQQKGIKVHKPRDRRAASETTKNVKAKQTYRIPFLQTWFCTIKLFQKNKRKAETVSLLRNKNDYDIQMQNKRTINRANIRYRHRHSKLLPYKCEPDICVPNECDPCKCERLIKLHHMKLKHKYSNTGDLTTRTTFSETSRTLSSSQNTPSYPRWSQEKANIIKSTERDTNEMNIAPNRSKRQAVRVRSSLRFNVEFCKKKSSANDRKKNVKTNEVKPRKHIRDNPIKKHEIGKLKTVGSQNVKPCPHHVAKYAESKRKEKRNCVTSAIKRCFCTLTFHKKGKKAKLQEINNVISKNTKTSYPLPNTRISDSKRKSTKISKPMSDLRSHECAPYFCIPGVCDEFYEEIKRRENKRSHGRHLGTDRYRGKSILSMNTNDLSGSLKTKTTQSRFLQETPKKVHKMRAVEEDMGSTRSLSSSRQANRMGSNISFNVEFNKDRSLLTFHETAYKIRGEKNYTFSDTRTEKKIKNKGTKEKRIVPKHRLLQAKNTKEDKVSNVGYFLKRCFCTLGLQKKNSVPKVKKSKCEFLRNQPISAQFLQAVQVDRNKKTACNYVIPHLKKRGYSKIVNGHNIINSRCSALNNTLFGRKSLELKLSESSPFRKNVHKYSKGNICYVPQHLSDSSSFTKSGHFKSRTGFNIDEYEVGYLVNDGPQKTNPFYQSFHALNLKVSKPIPKRSKRSELSGPNRPKTKSIMTTKKIKSANYHFNIKKNEKRKNKALRVGSDFNTDMDFFKENNPRGDGITFSTSNKSKKAKDVAKRNDIRVGSDVSIGMGFYNKIISDTNSRHGDVITSHVTALHKPKHSKDVPTQSLQSRHQHTASQMNNESKKKTKAVKQMLTKCLCPLNIKSENKKATETKPQKDMNTKAKKPFSNVILSENKKNVTDKLKLHKLQILPVHTDQQKHKSTPNLVNNKKKKTKKVQSKPEDGSARLKHSVSKKRLEKGPSQKHAVTFGSDISFIRRKIHSQSIRPSAPVRSGAIKGSGDHRTYGTGAIKCKCASKRDKKVKSILKRCECPTQTNKFNLNKADIKGKVGALRVIDPDVAKTTGTGVKSGPKTTGTGVKSGPKTTGTDVKSGPKTTSTGVKSGPRTTGTGIKKQTDLNKCINKCKCKRPFYNKKRGKSLTPKQSRARITDVRNKQKKEKKKEPTLKLEKGRKEMETIMPYSQKKFKKQKSKSKLAGINNCLCPPPPPVHKQEEVKKTMGNMVLKCFSFFNKCNKKEKSEKENPENEKPVFEMVVNKNNMNIVNRHEVLANLGSKGQYSEVMKKARKAAKQGEVLPPVMKMVIDKNNASIIKPRDFVHKVSAKGERIASSKSRVCICKYCECGKKKLKEFKPCVCGSIVCKADLEKLKKEDKSVRSVKLNQCICGSNVCKREMEKMPGKLLKAARKQQSAQITARQAMKKRKQFEKGRLMRQKMYAVEDAKRYKRRKRQDEVDMKQIKQYKNAPDILMVAESLQDLGKFGAKAFCDLMLNAFRMARHPKEGVQNVKEVVRDPERLMKTIKTTAKGAGFFSTVARIKQRLSNMFFLKKFVNTMEDHPVTNFIVHLPDTTPKKRMKKFKKKRFREPLDFQCSILMASLRKKPCLRIYFMCPWFYPHFMSMLTLYRQFLDIFLFILAVAVWSPCILAMELFRFLTCFLFCQA